MLDEKVKQEEQEQQISGNNIVEQIDDNEQQKEQIEVIDEQPQKEEKKEEDTKYEEMSDEDLRQMILEKRQNIEMREKQIRDMNNMLRDCQANHTKVEQLNMAADYELQDLYGKLEKRQEALKELLKTKEDLFTKLQKLQSEVDDLRS